MLSELSNISKVVNGPILFITAISLIFLVGLTITMVYFTIRYARRRNPEPAEVHGHTALEVAWTVIPTLLAFGMFWYGWVGYDYMKNPPADAIQVDVTGRMWSWAHEYENGVQSDVLRVPLKKPVQLNMSSADVLHSYYIPAFKVKQDAVPGVDNLFLWFEANQLGEYDVLCTEYCGLQHSGMLTKVIVMPVDEFAEWLATEGEKVAEMQAALAEVEEGGGGGNLSVVGQQLAINKGCVACHSADGTKLIGPSFKGIYGMEEVVVAGGQEKTIVVDDEYLRNSILNPNAEIVKGYQPLMPSQEGLVTDEEITAIIEYIKTLE